jgi:two-component system, NarL family, response regulator NreC
MGGPGRAALQLRVRRPAVAEIAAARERRGARDRTAIVLAHDHPLLREALRALLEAERDLRIIGECGDGREVVPTVKQLAPQVLVVCLMMPGLSGLEVTRQVRDQVPATRVVILSTYASELYAAQGLQHGAAGYVATAARGTHLVKAVRAAGSGRRYLSPPLTARGVDAHLQRTMPGAVDLYEVLTTREREVLHLAADGYGNPQVGAILGISTRTAETHRAHLMHKLGLGKPDGAGPLCDRARNRVHRASDPPIPPRAPSPPTPFAINPPPDNDERRAWSSDIFDTS